MIKRTMQPNVSLVGHECGNKSRIAKLDACITREGHLFVYVDGVSIDDDATISLDHAAALRLRDFINEHINMLRP